jgi:hypothetical protein
MRVPALMREQAASDKPAALAISLSVKASSFGAISRSNQASSRSPGCSRAQLRLRVLHFSVMRYTVFDQV